MRHRRVNGVDNLKRLRELVASKLKELAGLGESNGQAYEANDWDNKLAQLVSAKQQGKQLGSVALTAAGNAPRAISLRSTLSSCGGELRPHCG